MSLTTESVDASLMRARWNNKIWTKGNQIDESVYTSPGVDKELQLRLVWFGWMFADTTTRPGVANIYFCFGNDILQLKNHDGSGYADLGVHMIQVENDPLFMTKLIDAHASRTFAVWKDINGLVDSPDRFLLLYGDGNALKVRMQFSGDGKSVRFIDVKTLDRQADWIPRRYFIDAYDPVATEKLALLLSISNTNRDAVQGLQKDGELLSVMLDMANRFGSGVIGATLNAARKSQASAQEQRERAVAAAKDGKQKGMAATAKTLASAPPAPGKRRAAMSGMSVPEGSQDDASYLWTLPRCRYTKDHSSGAYRCIISNK